MKTRLLLTIFTSGVFSLMQAQFMSTPKELLDTIPANDKMNVALFFPDPIRQGIAGSGNIVFTYNRERAQHMGLLQATPGNLSNLLVISSTGSVFSYIIKYTEELERLNYFIPDASRIGKEGAGLPPVAIDTAVPVIPPKAAALNNEKQFYYRNYSRQLLRSKQRLGRIQNQREGISLVIRNIVFDREEFYYVFEIENSSSIDYDIGYLNVVVQTRKKGRRKSFQQLVQQPLYKYKFPSVVRKGERSSFVYVLPKFSISSNKKVIVTLREKQGERAVVLPVGKRFVNRPN